MKIRNYIKEYLEYLEVVKNKSPKTIENYTHYLKRFQEFIKDDIDPKDITLKIVQNFRLHLNRLIDDKGGKLGIKTQNYHIIALRAFLKYLIRHDIKTLAPEKIELASTGGRTVEVLSREELDRLFKAVDRSKNTGLRDYAIIETLYSTGLRVSELANLNIDQIDLKRREFWVRGKGRKPRIVFLSNDAADSISKYLKSRSDNFKPVFTNTGRGRLKNEDVLDDEKARLSTVSIEKIVRSTALRGGIIKKVTPHTLRHSYATQLLINGADIRSVQEMLGHSSITTTQVYTHVTDKKLREIHDKFHK